MFEIKEVRLRDVVHYKKIKLQLNKPGLVFVRGVNKDSDEINPTGNAAGKSLLFSTLPNLVYFSPPAATRKNSKKELLGKGSSIQYSFKQDKDNYIVEQRSTGYSIIKNNEDLQLKRIPEAESYIRQLFPLQEIDYYTYGYISTQRPYLMQTDNDLNRLDHLTSIFRLGAYDEMKQYFSKKLVTAKADEVRLSVVTQKLILANKELKDLTTGEDIDVNYLNTIIEQLDTKYRKAVKEEHEIETLLVQLKILKEIEQDLDKLRILYKHKQPPKDRLVFLKEQKPQIKAFEHFQEKQKEYSKNKERLKTKLENLPTTAYDDKELISLRKKLSSIEKEEQEKKVAYKLFKEKQAKLTELTSLLKGKEVTSTEEQLTIRLTECRSTVKLKQLLKHKHLKGNVCPVCASQIDLNSIRNTVKKAEEEIPVLEEQLRLLNLKQKYKNIKKELKQLEISDSLFDSLKKTKKTLLHRIEDLEERKQLLTKRGILEQELNQLKKPNTVGKPTLDLTLDQVEKEFDLCNDILKHLASKEKVLQSVPVLKDCRTVKLVEEEKEKQLGNLRKIQTTVAKYKKKLAKLNQRLTDFKTKEAKENLLKSQIKELEKEQKELLPSVEKKRALDYLVRAYSPKGLKTLAANEIAALLEQNLNHYRYLTFVEPFVFTVSASEKGLSIKVDRNNGLVSDVRNLSGAESDSFRQLFLLSVLPLIPDSRKLNMVVLDEPCSHSDEVTRQTFLTKFLPTLLELVPTVYVITPNKDDYIEGSRELVITKSKGKAFIKEF